MHAASSERRASNGRPGASATKAAGLDQGRKGLAEPTPFDPWARAAQLAIIGLFVIALLWSAQASQPVLVPVLLAWVIATILLPVVRFLRDQGVPRALAAVLLTVALVGATVSSLLLLAGPVSTWLGRATELQLLLQQKFQMLSQPLALLDEAKKSLSAITSEPGAVKVQQPSANVVTATFDVLMPASGHFVLFVGALLFYLIYQERIRKAAVMLFSGREARLEALHTLQCIDDNMTTYFSTCTVVNLCLGVLTCGLAYAAGLPNALLWGVFACVLNYIPYLGPAIVAGTLALVGLLTFPSLGGAAVAPLAYMAIVVVEGQFITPYLMGRRLELNPFAVFLAIAFCLWLWGAVGAFLAVPLLMAVTVAAEHAFAEAKPALPD
ncbi:MAG TPA: AI-2E family transporter [Hyphomicrobiaceae bacterium]|jgi:predicted PurR-regulated permease PerM